jgi:hypothetical protein
MQRKEKTTETYPLKDGLTPFHFVWCKGLHQSRLVSSKHRRLYNTFNTVIFGIPNSLLALATDLRGLH